MQLNRMEGNKQVEDESDQLLDDSEQLLHRQSSERSVSDDDAHNLKGRTLDSPVMLKRGMKRIIDETQLDEDEAKKLETRRAYNRHCAAKARKRSKDLISHLTKQVEELTKEKAALERSNEVMRAQMDLLEQQNRTLMLNQRMSQGTMGASSFPMAMSSPALLVPGNAASIGAGSLYDSLLSQSGLRLSSAPQGGFLPGALGRPSAAPGPSSGGSGAFDSKLYLG